MVSRDHKRRVLAHQAAQIEKPLVVFSSESQMDRGLVEEEDGGQALIFEVDLTNLWTEAGMFVRVQSWDPEKRHEDIQRLFGRKIEITIRTLD